MNSDLKKATIIKKNYAAKYMERHQTLCVTLDKTEDADIIEWLNKQDNRSRSVRKVLRKEARYREDEQARRVLFGDPKTEKSKA